MDEVGSFKAWLLRIVTNTCYDHLRTLQRHRTVSLEESTENPESSIMLSDRRGSPEEHALRSELREVVQKGIAVLPDDQRVVLILYDIEGFGYRPHSRR